MYAVNFDMSWKSLQERPEYSKGKIRLFTDLPLQVDFPFKKG